MSNHNQIHKTLRVAILVKDEIASTEFGRMIVKIMMEYKAS